MIASPCFFPSLFQIIISYMPPNPTIGISVSSSVYDIRICVLGGAGLGFGSCPGGRDGSGGVEEVWGR